MDLSAHRVQELLRLEAEITAELRQRGLVRTNNKPLGDIAEQVVLNARGGVLAPNSTKSHDITTVVGQRLQVKAMGGRAAGASAKFSPFRSSDFDFAVFLVFDAATFSLVEAFEVPSAIIVEQVRYVAHINGRQPTLRQVRSLGQDVGVEMRMAFDRIDVAPPAPLP